MSTHKVKPGVIKNTPRWLIISCLILAGEMIFSLPFHVMRYFRPTFLEVFQLTNTQVGDAIAIYGVTAVFAYFPSGIIADRFSGRKLMSISLFATALGGVWMTTIPNQQGLALLFGYWGITNILLFWSAMLRTTREWGGEFAQGRAFGLLDGGRGLVGAGAATIAVFFLANLLPDNLETILPEQRQHALISIIWFYSILTFLTSILIWLFVPDTKLKSSASSPVIGIRKVLSNHLVWLQAVVVICAYCGYRGLDFYSLYGIDILGLNEVSSARFMSNATYLRPVAAIGAGFLADRFSTRKVILSTFIVLLLGYVMLFLLAPSPKLNVILFVNLIFTIISVYALRGVYFALFKETNVSGKLTGTAVGLVSLVGFTPDIFFYSIGGRIIDASPGLKGFHNFYLFLMAFAVTGIVAILLLTRGKDKTR